MQILSHWMLQIPRRSRAVVTSAFRDIAKKALDPLLASGERFPGLLFELPVPQGFEDNLSSAIPRLS